MIHKFSFSRGQYYVHERKKKSTKGTPVNLGDQKYNILTSIRHRTSLFGNNLNLSQSFFLFSVCY